MDLSRSGMNPSVLLPLLLLGFGTLAAGVRICRFAAARPSGVVLAATGSLLVTGVVLDAAGLASAWTVAVATCLAGPVAVLLYPRIEVRDWLHWVLIGVCAVAGTVAVLAPVDGPWITAALVTIAATIAAHLWWRGERRTVAERRAVSWLSVGVVAAVVAYAVLAFLVVPNSAVPVGSQALATAAVPAAMLAGVQRPLAGGLRAVTAKVSTAAAAAVLVVALYATVIALLTQATGRPTLIAEEALVVLLCAVCFELLRGRLHTWAGRRWSGARPGLVGADLPDASSAAADPSVRLAGSSSELPYVALLQQGREVVGQGRPTQQARRFALAGSGTELVIGMGGGDGSVPSDRDIMRLMLAMLDQNLRLHGQNRNRDASPAGGTPGLSEDAETALKQDVHAGLGRRLAGIAHSTYSLSDLLHAGNGVEPAEARRLLVVVQKEAAAALEEVRRLSPADPA